MFGLLTKPLVGLLLPSRRAGGSGRSSDTGSPGEEEDGGAALSLLAVEDAAGGILEAKGSFSLLLARPAHTIHAYWRRFDDTYMRPIFGGPL